MNTEPERSEKLYLFAGYIIGHNSYSQLCRYFPAGRATTVISTVNVFTRLVCKIYDVLNGIPPRDKAISYHELYLELLLRFSFKPFVVHFLFGEEHCNLLRRLKDRSRRNAVRLVFSVHQPFHNWAAEDVRALGGLDGLITMCESDSKLFAEQLPHLPVQCIPHGVDVVYWKERPFPSAPKKRIGYCGKHLRNISMFMRVARRALQERQDVEFYCLIPPGGMNDDWVAFSQLPNVRILSDLSPDDVLGFYQGLYALMMPLNETTANNVIVESLSCGVPLLSTNVGGIATYGGGTVFPVVKNDDDEALYAELSKLLDDPELCRKTGAACRAFAENTLSWPRIVALHEAFYRDAGQPKR